MANLSDLQPLTKVLTILHSKGNQYIEIRKSILNCVITHVSKMHVDTEY